MTTEQLNLQINGKTHELETPVGRTLLTVLREDLDLTGAKKACDNGECGSCIVLLGNKPAKSCLLAARRAQGKPIVTIEGVASQSLYSTSGAGAAGNTLHPLQRAFLELGATQCGFCIPGMIMKANALLIGNNNPTRDEVVKSLSGNLCRCTGYMKIIEAVLKAAEMIRGNSAPEPVESGGPVVGQSVPRLDSPHTVNGAAKYAADLKMDGMLHAKLLRSPHHHARILSVDTAEAAAMPGVCGVITAADIPGTPYLPNCQPQVFVFPRDKVRFRGEAVAAVAAVSEEIAEKALEKINVQYELLPSILDADDAMDPSAPLLFDGEPNVSATKEIVFGDIEKGFSQADVIVENTYSVPVREHAAMEPEAALAYKDDDGRIVIKTPLYHPFVQGQESIAANLAVPRDRVRIICPAMGGNFGTRGDTLAAVVVALLAIKTDKPVKIVFGRAESLLGSCKAPWVKMKYRTGATKDGRLVALDVDILHGAGSWAPHLIPATTQGAELCYYETLGALLSHVTGPYEIPHVRARARDVLTNAPRFVPLRGTNGNYLPLAYESQIDVLAEKLGIDPLEFRLRNTVDVGSMTHIGQVLSDSVGMRAELEALRPHYAEAKQRLQLKQSDGQRGWRAGIGIACGWRNIGYVNTTISAAAELLPDGRVRILAGTVEQGQGPTTQFAQIAADAIGLPMEMLVIGIGDTLSAPYPVPTFSSITTVGTGKAVQTACENLKRAIIDVASEIFHVDHAQISIDMGSVFCASALHRRLSLAQIARHVEERGGPLKCEGHVQWQGEAPNILYGYNAGLVELEVNEQTGQVRLEHIVNVCDPGTIVNPLALEGQVDGGIGFGIGFALKEEFHPEKPATFEAYGLPTTRDIPGKVTRLFVGGRCERGPFGAKSAGEMPGISPIPAIINGIANATGVRVRDIPATPDRVRAALASGR
ncbi:MAG TPA: molybdopterin cofactor-binding domain-containing protein [Alphaproteobacteria bacterium]|nr:molybdopterin cofactor-binding domain-containing protein [Alphaproteobacteria bacterium]